MREVMNGAVWEIGNRDSQKCAEHACRAILADKKRLMEAKGRLRPKVLAKIQSAGISFFKGLLKRHEPFVALPKPLRNTSLHRIAKEIGLVTREETVKVDVATLKEECLLAGARKEMNMVDDIGRESKRVMMQKKKGKHVLTTSLKTRNKPGLST